MVSPMQHAQIRVAVVWVDGWHALVARTRQGEPIVTEIDRDTDAERDYLARVARIADDCDRLMIVGPGGIETTFESAYSAMYGRSRRFIEAETAPAPSQRELTERLRLLDPDERRH